MNMNFKDLLASKTFWAVLAAIVSAASGYCTHQMSLFQAITAILGALGLMGVRDAVHQDA